MDKLKIESINSSGKPVATFVAMLNPNTVKYDLGIRYTDGQCKHKQSQGSIAPKTLFEGYDSEKLNFDILLDGTGVVEQKKVKTVNDQLNLLKKVTYSYNGKEHEPLPVKLTWGKTLSFKGRLTSMGVSYTLFDTSGNPLRATINLQFTQFWSEEEKQAMEKKSSPDLTHIVEFKAGDTLPQLCQKIYKDCSYYIDVARVNNLPNVRQITPGTLLYFPPLV